MIVKAFELRDRGTFIPCLAVKMVPYPEGKTETWDNEAERYLLRRAGYGFVIPCVVLCRMEASGVDRNATYDPFAWGGGTRTYQIAHQYIIDHFDELESGAVVDVEFLLGETTQPKVSERLG